MAIVALGLKSEGHETAFYRYVTLIVAFLVSLRLPRQALHAYCACKECGMIVCSP